MCKKKNIIANIYIPPQNSSFYKIHSCDLFYELENQIVKYLEECPNIFVIGDLNARTVNSYDFVQNEFLHVSISDRVGDMIAYVADETLPVRRNRDTWANMGQNLLICVSLVDSVL